MMYDDGMIELIHMMHMVKEMHMIMMFDDDK